jgi:hypothetical protein
MITETNNDPVLDFLSSAIEAKLEIIRHRMRAEELESRCTKVTASMSGMPGGGNSDAQLLWSTLVDERDKERAAEKRETEVYRSVENFISEIPNKTYRAILKLRYLNGLEWVNVQMKMYEAGIFYSERHIYRLHDCAIEAARELWRTKEAQNAVHS